MVEGLMEAMMAGGDMEEWMVERVMEKMTVGGPLEEWMVVGSREDQMASEIPERPRRRP